MNFRYFVKNFYKAAFQGDIEELERLIKKGMDVNYQTGIVGGWLDFMGDAWPPPFDVGSALHFAVIGDQENAVQFLVDRGADVNIRDDDDNTPLSLAVGDKHEIAKILIKSGAEVNVLDINHKHLFLKFIGERVPINYNTELLKLLITKGIDLNVQYKRNGNTALTYIIEYDLKYIQGIDANVQDVDLRYNHILSISNLEYIKILIESGANPCICNMRGKSVLDYLYTLPEDLRLVVEDKLKNRSKMCKAVKV